MQTSTQTGPLSFSTITTQTQPAKEEDCQCEDNKSILPFESNFARQLQPSQPTQHPIEYIQQQTISHTPQQQLQYTQPAISHTQYPHHTSQVVLQDVIKVIVLKIWRLIINHPL